MVKFCHLPGLFLYTTSVAVVHRQDTYGIILPPIYEIYPWFFFNTDVMQEAYKYKMVHNHDSKVTKRRQELQ